MSSDTRQKIGAMGENIASNFLRQKGYQIIDRNYRCQLGELDIIAIFEDDIIFCEVKTRKYSGVVHPSASVTHAKMQKIRKLAQWYLTQYSYHHLQPRFDVVTVCLQTDLIIEHFINAF